MIQNPTNHNALLMTVNRPQQCLYNCCINAYITLVVEYHHIEIIFCARPAASFLRLYHTCDDIQYNSTPHVMLSKCSTLQRSKLIVQCTYLDMGSVVVHCRFALTGSDNCLFFFCYYFFFNDTQTVKIALMTVYHTYTRHTPQCLIKVCCSSSKYVSQLGLTSINYHKQFWSGLEVLKKKLS